MSVERPIIETQTSSNDPVKVDAFVEQYNVRPILTQTTDIIKRHFGDAPIDPTLAYDMDDEEGEPIVALYIETNETPEAALDRLHQFDQDCFTEGIDNTHIVVHVRFGE